MFCFKKLISVVAFLLFFPGFIYSQTTIAFQGFEGTAADNWSFTSPTQAAGPGQVIVGVGNFGATYSKTGNYSMRAGGGSTACGTGSGNCVNGASLGGSCNNLPNGGIVQFSTVNVACLNGVQISVSHRCHVLCGGQGQGFDAGENLFFEVSLNGGSWSVIGTLGGLNNYLWTYSTSPAGSGSTIANPFVYNVPPGTNTIAFRTRSQTNRSDEVYYIDDVTLTTNTTGYNFPGTAGLWNGNVNTDWTNKCNWDDRNVPTNVTDVYIPNGAVNICEVLPTLTGNCHDLRIDKSKLAAEYFTSTLNVSGNLTIDNNGELDMSLSGIEGGTLNISGNWLNKRDETFFDEGKSTVNFLGLFGQSITINNDTKESYFKLGVNKVAWNLTTNTDIWIDKMNVGGTTNLLTFSNGLLDLNSHELTIWNPNFQAVVRSGGGVVSEKINNSSKMTWRMNTNTGSFLFPFSRFDGTYIPFTFNHTSGDAGDVSLATYGTPPDNLPWPTTPIAVSNLISATGLMPDNRDATVDRFWEIDVSGTATADLTFSYASSELPIAPYNNPNSMKAQRYANSTNLWMNYLPGQVAGNYFVTVPAVNTFSPWTITNQTSPLPIELLFFEAKAVKSEVEVAWETVTEIDNDYFTVQRSKNGIDFEDVGTVDGAGNSNTLLNYKYMDLFPYDGISYYRLKQTDFDGRFSFSKIVPVSFHSSISGSSIELVSVISEDNQVNALIHTSGSEPLKVELIDILGRVLDSRSVTPKERSFSVRLNSSGLNAGVYFFKITDGVNEQIKKIVIN